MTLRIPLFAYGLYMDTEILKTHAVIPQDPHIGVVRGYEIKIGEKATMIPNPSEVVWGVAFMLTHADIDTLYAPFNGLYQPEAMLMEMADGKILPAVGYIIKPIPQVDTVNIAYVEKLYGLVQKLGFDADYVEQIKDMLV